MTLLICSATLSVQSEAIGEVTGEAIEAADEDVEASAVSVESVEDTEVIEEAEGAETLTVDLHVETRAPHRKYSHLV